MPPRAQDEILVVRKGKFVIDVTDDEEFPDGWS